MAETTSPAVFNSSMPIFESFLELLEQSIRVSNFSRNVNNK
jgi:hypothetical protein